MIDINVIHNKGNIDEAEGKGNYFRLVTLKTNDIEFCSNDIGKTLDKQYVLDGYDSYVESGQRLIFLNTTSAYKIGSNNTNL